MLYSEDFPMKFNLYKGPYLHKAFDTRRSSFHGIAHPKPL
ncbi:hypothetical protein RGAI101_3197 [Roseobacter sp. GAI101]|nr:hypothetical protein RGAI101_3197 [Roseobacter sp. GAI101]